MIALRVRPNSRIDLITKPHRALLDDPMPGGSARRSHQKYVAQENCTVGDDGLTRFPPLQNLAPVILLKACLDGSFGETAPVAGDPHRHRPVTFPDHPVRWYR